MRRYRVIEARQLHRGHFAFLRAVLQGVDPATSWSAYMQLESLKANDRKSREMAAWIRDECVAAAHDNGQHRAARLLQLELAVSAGADKAESIDHATGASLSTAAFETSAVDRNTVAHKRARLVQQQLDALRRLEERMLARMSAGDPVSRWFPQRMADLLERAGISTLSLLIARIRNDGDRWWRDVPAVSWGKATRIADWASTHAQDIGFPFFSARPNDEQTEDLERSGPSTTLVPFEYFLVPYELDGHDGVFRVPRSECLLTADNDRQAIEAWLNDTQHALRAPTTIRRYRTEAERLLLWCVLVRHKPVSSLTHADVKAYRDFLLDPPDYWCGWRGSRRDSPQWRPMEKGLSAPALAMAFTCLGSLFTYLVSHQYVYGHPFLVPRSIGVERPDAGLLRTLTFTQWNRIDGDLTAELEIKATHEPTRRRARAIRWLYATGLSLSEMIAVQCGALRLTRFNRADGISDCGWVVLVVGRNQKAREVPVQAQLIAELRDELARAGRPRSPTHRANARVPIVGRFSAADGGIPPAWTAGSLNQSIKTFMAACASRLGGEDAAQVRLATSGWLRNTHGMHAVKGWNDSESKSVPVHHIAANMGYRSARQISQHLHSTTAERQETMKSFWPPEESP